MIVQPNWGAFAAKFDGREQKAFEWFCSLLFSKEHNQRIGPLRYLNQAGIEEDPIALGDEVIGWQAKYVGRLSEQTQTLKKAIDDAKLQNPSLTRIYFYLNVDFAPSRRAGGAKEPQTKLDIEEHASSKGVAVTWRTRNFFEKPFVSEENAHIARYFFTAEKSSIDFIQELSRHTETVLQLIRSEIVSNGTIIKLNRHSVVARLTETLKDSPAVIISGEAGVGKTAIVKDFYAVLKSTAPLFMFKSTEFGVLTAANQLFRDYGDFTLSDLVQEFAGIDEKYIVIDSAEELSGIEHPEIFQEILATFRQTGWKVIFTTRLSFLDDLERTLIQLYGVSFKPLNVENLTSGELEQFSQQYKFALPESDRLRELLRNPFYLNEYLRDNPKGQSTLGYSDFRDAMWNARIAKTAFTKNNAHRKREQCFLEIAQKRAATGRFFVSFEGSDEALAQLEADEIIRFDPSAGGYFIAHDIYAEWALDKIIERAFRTSSTNEDFYRSIGSSLPVRRAFRAWLSEKLLLDNDDAKRLIEATIESNGIERHWKDEVIVAALLSAYADVFINYISARLLAKPTPRSEKDDSTTATMSARRSHDHEDRLLVKLLFLLRIACKDLDHDLLKTFGANRNVLSQLFARPKGSGWASVIAFLNKHRQELGPRYLKLALPVLDEWNRYNKSGPTTEHAAQLALHYYRELTGEDGHFPYGTDKDLKDRLIETIFNGSSEIAVELKLVFDQVVADGDASRQRPYFELARAALSDLTKSSKIAEQLPNESLALAKLFWIYKKPKRSSGFAIPRSVLNMETFFNLASNHQDYYPASAFQTPIFALLRTAPLETVDFILELTNQSVEYFATTELGSNEVEEIELDLGEHGSVKQYVCHRIWNIYRGTQVAPDLLESIHMALERWLLLSVSHTSPEILESWCLYLIKNSRSASTTAVMVSIVLAEPNKLFNVAQLLFRNRDLFFFDTSRLQLDMTAKSTYAITHDRTGGFFTNERLKTCDDAHRKMSLEHLCLRYQVFRDRSVTEAEVGERQKVIWNIFDEHYARLPSPSVETEVDKTWRLCLARMDRRKMNITAETKDDQVLISFNPEIDPELKKYSDEGVARGSEMMKYIPLKLWAHYRFEHNESEYKKYPQYETDNKLVIADTKLVIDGLNSDQDGEFSLYYSSVPAYACAVLMRDYLKKLEAEEKRFCKDILIDQASMPQNDSYRYQVADGVGAATKVLPQLLKVFPEESDRIKELLLFALFNENPIGMNQTFSENAVSAIVDGMWADHSNDANSLFLGYLLLKPKLNALWKSAREESWRRREVDLSPSTVRDRFVKACSTEIGRIIHNQMSFDELPALDQADAAVLIVGFSLLPLWPTDECHKNFVQQVCELLVDLLLDRHNDDKIDYMLRVRFFDKLANFVLTSDKSDIEKYIRPFLPRLRDSRESANLISALVSAEDKLHRYDEFWATWDLFYPSIKRLCEREVTGRYYSSEVVYNYLLAWPYWRKGIKEWRSLKVREKAFFKQVAEEIGGHPAVLYSLAKLLNEIGSGFVEDGIGWISGIIERTPALPSRDLEVNTVYYLENLVRGYVLQNRHKVRTMPQTQQQVLTILNFLLEKGSATAYLLREDIL